MTSIATPQLASLPSSASVTPVQLQQSQALGQMIGQILTGTVIALLNDTTLRLQTPAGQLDITAETPLPAGTPVAITVQGTAQQPQIVIAPAVVASAAQGSVPPPAQAGVSGETSPAQTGPNAIETSSTAAGSANSSVANATELTSPSGAAARATPPLTQAALSTAAAIVRNAAATQGSLVALYADLEAAVTAPAPSLPAPVLDAAKLLLAMRLDATSSQDITADDVRAALTQSGFTTAVPAAQTSAPAEAPDLGTALVALRQTLQSWRDQESDAKTEPVATNATAPQTPARANVPAPSYRGAPVPQALALPSLSTTVSAREQIARLVLQAGTDAQIETSPPNIAALQVPARANIPMPPFLGSPSVPQAPVAPSLSATASPREQASHLLSETDAAIARQTLLRLVSLPTDQPSGTPRGNDNSARVMFEIPVATALGTGIAPMTITHDGRKGDCSENPKSWIATFSIDLAAIGPVHVRIALVGERASVTLSAEHAPSADLLASELPLLDAGLRGARIEPGELRCRVGSAAGGSAATLDGSSRLQTAAPGMFLDQAS
jgi:Flagellar hook-length control protein FliK